MRNTKLFLEKVNQYWPSFKAGLDAKTPVFDTLLGFTMDQLHYLQPEQGEDDVTRHMVIVYLTCMIMGYPKGKFTVKHSDDDAEFGSLVNSLCLKATLATLQKAGYMECFDDSVKLDLEKEYKMVPFDTAQERLIEKYGDKL